MAKRCELDNGPKIEFSDYIYKLWDKIGQVELDPDINDEHVCQNGGLFTPVQVPAQDTSKCAGVSVKTFPKETDHAEIVEFLIYSGLSEDHKDDISIRHNGSVIIKNLQSMEFETLIAAIHNQVNFGRRLYCNGVIPRTPDKPEQQPAFNVLSTEQLPAVTLPSVEQPLVPLTTTTTASTSSSTTTSPSKSLLTVPSPLSPLSPFSQL